MPCMALWAISTRQLLSVFSSNLNLRKWGYHGTDSLEMPQISPNDLEKNRERKGISWDIMAYHGISWDIMGYHGISWYRTGQSGIERDMIQYDIMRCICL